MYSLLGIVQTYLTNLTIAVPPGLVACLSIATSISVSRLLIKNISVTDTTKVNTSGYVNYVCFDKTGTLTDSEIMFQGVLNYKYKPNINIVDVDNISNEVMAACHSLSFMNNKAVGDSLEVELLRASGWLISQDKTSTNLIISKEGKSNIIIKQFEYTPDKLRSGVILKRFDDNIYLVKGSPETIASLSVKDSIPFSLNEDIDKLTKQGYRVLAFGYSLLENKSLNELLSVEQEQLETSIVFLGLVYFSNKLKVDTYPITIQELKDANIQVKMITGDHMNTAIAIASECNILSKNRIIYLIDVKSTISNIPVIKDYETGIIVKDLDFEKLIKKYYHNVDKDIKIEIVMSGAGLKSLQLQESDSIIEELTKIASVFARTKPMDKKLVVNLLKKNDHILFCGDGANDMEALSAATVGVSLCDTATTVAASVISTKQTPYATVELLKEGRCSLITAYILVMFNIMYAIIQLFMTCYLNGIGLVFGDYLYLVQDLFFSLVLGLTISNTGPYNKLDVKLPPITLFNKGLMIKLFLQLIIFPLVQYITLLILYSQDWFVPYKTDSPLTESYATESGVLNIIALSQLMIASVVVTIGKPFRMPWYSSKEHIIVLILQSCYVLWLIFGTNSSFMASLDNIPTPHSFGFVLILIIICNSIISGVATKFADTF